MITKNKNRVLYSFLGILIACVFVSFFRYYRYSQCKGGEINAEDFKTGVEVCLEESYTLNNEDKPFFSESDHCFWKITNGDVSEKLLRICSTIKCYRQRVNASDIMLGGETFKFLPTLYLITDSVGYKIEIMNWANYSGSEWDGFSIRNEMYGRPVLLFYRINLDSRETLEDKLCYAKQFQGSDSLNEYGCSGWYSTLSLEQMNELLSIIEMISSENAIIVD